MSDTTTFKVGDKVRFRARAQSSTEPMVIKKIDGEDHYLDWDARPWLAANLILDSEWKEMHDTRPVYQKLGLPLVERGIPVPREYKPERKGNRTKPASKWPAFLKNLRPGDSFMLEYPAAGTVKQHARALGIKLVWQRTWENGPRGMCQERIWRAYD